MTASDYDGIMLIEKSYCRQMSLSTKLPRMRRDSFQKLAASGDSSFRGQTPRVDENSRAKCRLSASSYLQAELQVLLGPIAGSPNSG